MTNLTEHGLNADSVVTSDANGISTVTQMGLCEKNKQHPKPALIFILFLFFRGRMGLSL